MTRTLSATLVIAISLSAFLRLSGAVPVHLAVAAMVMFVLIVMWAGFLLLRVAGAPDMPATAAWVIGVCATALAVYALAVLFHLLAVTAFAIWGLVIVAWGLGVHKAPLPSIKIDAKELGGLLLCAGATFVWCGDMAQVPRVLAEHGVLSTWTDQFIHGSLISQFGDPRASGRQAIQLADLPLPLYHYGSYVLPAVFASPLDLPGLTLATSVWVPMGFFTLCAGAYSLGMVLGREAGALAALAVLTVVPDAASYGLYNRLFGFYWYVVAVPGAAYAVGIVLLAIAFLQRWSEDREWRPLIAGAGLVIGTLFVRLHIFALAFSAWLIYVALATPFVRRNRSLFALTGAGVFALFVWAFYAVFPDSAWALPGFLDITHNQQQPVPYRGLYQGLTAMYGPAVAMSVGILLIIPACLGIFLLLYPISLLLSWRAGRLAAIDVVPIVVFFCYLLLILTAPVPAYGDATELTHRPFVLLYAVVAVWTAVQFSRWISAHGGLGAPRIRLALLFAVALSVFAVLRYTVSDWRWRYSYAVAEGLPQAANFMRSHWRPGDTLAAQGIRATLTTTDLAVQLVSMTGIPAYIALPFMQSSRGGAYANAAAERYAALLRVADQHSVAAAMSMLNSLGLRWYVVAERDHRGPRWDLERRHAAFVDRMVAVYEVN